MAFRTDGNQPIELDEEQAITVGQLDSAAFALQYNHLLPERGILGRKLAL
jgi:hypothetical protein